MIRYAMSITLVISYATVNIRSAMSDGGGILHDLPLVRSLYFFCFRAREKAKSAGGFCVSEAQCQVLSELQG